MDIINYALSKKNGGGGSGGGLPPITSADDGKVLTANSGVWGAQEPIGKKFIVTLTPTDVDFSGTMDKTVAEINAAYEAGREIWFAISDNYNTYMLPMSAVALRQGYTYPSFHGRLIYDVYDVWLYTGDTATGTDTGTSTVYGTVVYTLTPAT